MKYTLLLLLIFVMSCFPALAQQIENPGFEEWEDAGTVIDEPVDWSSIKTSDAGSLINNAAPQVWDISDDAHSGSYSVKLTNTIAFSIVATGTLTNGRIHADFNPDSADSHTDPTDPRWHTPFHWRPDSLAGWFKYYPTSLDRATVKAVLHVGEGKLPENGTMQNWVGVAEFLSTPGVTHDEWTRFSVPFEYNGDERNPEYILLVITAGDGTMAIANSYVLFDDFELIYNNANVDEKPLAKNALYVFGRTVYLDKLPREFQSGSELSVTDLSGRVVWQTTVQSERIDMPSQLTNEGIYIVSVRSGREVYRQKLYIR